MTPGSIVYFTDESPTTHESPSFGASATGANGSAVLIDPEGDLQILGCDTGDPLEVRPIVNLYLLRGLVC